MISSRTLIICSLLLLTVATAQAVEHFVSIPGFEFSPAEITISEGDIVTWTNNHSVTHTSTSDDGGVEWDSGPLLPGESFSHIFADPGVYPYHCAFHPSMTGTVTVNTSCQSYTVGDYNGSGVFNIADIVESFSWLKSGSPEPALLCECPAGSGVIWAVAMDVNNSCSFNVADVVSGFSYLKTGTPTPSPCQECPPGGR